MVSSNESSWQRFQKFYWNYPPLGLSLDLSCAGLSDSFLSLFEPRLQAAFEAMARLEAGEIANPDENRMVGHYWLRTPALAPTSAIREQIENTIREIRLFARQVHEQEIRGASGPFKNLLVIGIGGSALGPEFVSHALGNSQTDKMRVHFFDNTDPDGMDNILSQIGPSNLGFTLCIVISKSGGTKETRNGMLEAQNAYSHAGLNFGTHAVAVTGSCSELDRFAQEKGWLRRFPMWDWVGGRTSELSAVGLLPAALQGIDIDHLLEGARLCDEVTRDSNGKVNPAGLLAAAWHFLGNGKGDRNMVVLPYKDRLELFSKYLQQLLMESLGKAKDLEGRDVHQGLTVFGNKGSTDQHSYIQQLRDGLNNFYVLFIRILRDRTNVSIEVEPDVTSGDYLDGFLLGTRQALYENSRYSITITVNEVTAFGVGALIALFERTVGLYANLIRINAYHQPGVEAGKKAAGRIIEWQRKILRYLRENKNSGSVEQIAGIIGCPEEVVFQICRHLAANPDHRIEREAGATIFQDRFKSI